MIKCEIGASDSPELFIDNAVPCALGYGCYRWCNCAFFQTPSETVTIEDVGPWLLMASEIATQASFNFGTSDFAWPTLIRKTGADMLIAATTRPSGPKIGAPTPPPSRLFSCWSTP